MRPTNIHRVSLTKSVFNRFFSVFHPPLPLSPLESRKFLTLVKESFRTQLNAAAPDVAPTEQHFSEIMAAAQSSGIPVIDGLNKEERIKRFLDDPLGVFNEQVLIGKATVDLAAVCLTEYAKLQRAAGAEAVENQKNRNSVAFVLEGLRKAGFGPAVEVLKHRNLVRVVCHMLVIEGREEAILRWARATKQESTSSVAQDTLKHGIYFMGVERGWKSAENMFRKVMTGLRESQSRFSQRVHYTTGLWLCELGMTEGFAETPEFMRLIRSSIHWANSWQYQARVHLKYARMTGVGVRYFYDLAQRDDGFWQHQKPFWYHQNSKLAMELAIECLAQHQVQEAEMITKLARMRFAGKALELHLDDTEVKIETGEAFIGKEKAVRESGDGDYISELQGILNTLR